MKFYQRSRSWITYVFAHMLSSDMWQPQMQESNMIHSSDCALNNTVLDEKHGDKLSELKQGNRKKNHCNLSFNFNQLQFNMVFFIKRNPRSNTSAIKIYLSHTKTHEYACTREHMKTLVTHAHAHTWKHAQTETRTCNHTENMCVHADAHPWCTYTNSKIQSADYSKSTW